MIDYILSHSRQLTTRTYKDPTTSPTPTYFAPKNLQKDDIINISSSSTNNINGKDRNQITTKTTSYTTTVPKSKDEEDSGSKIQHENRKNNPTCYYWQFNGDGEIWPKIKQRSKK